MLTQLDLKFIIKILIIAAISIRLLTCVISKYYLKEEIKASLSTEFILASLLLQEYIRN